MIKNLISEIKEVLVKEGGKYVLVVASGERFNFKKLKADGSITQQYIQMYEEKGELRPGTLVKVGYEEAEYKGVNYNKLVSVYPYTPKPGEVVSQPKTETPTPRQEQTRDSSIVRQVAFKGTVELIISGKIVLAKDLESSVREWTDKFQRIMEARALDNPIQELPTVTEETPANSIPTVEDIPF